MASEHDAARIATANVVRPGRSSSASSDAAGGREAQRLLKLLEGLSGLFVTALR